MGWPSTSPGKRSANINLIVGQVNQLHGTVAAHELPFVAEVMIDAPDVSISGQRSSKAWTRTRVRSGRLLRRSRTWDRFPSASVCSRFA